MAILKHLNSAAADIFGALRHLPLVGLLAWQDVKQRYRRSLLGPFWLTISMGVMIGTIFMVFGQIFNVSMHDFLPFLAIGLILWTLLSSVLSEACTAFIGAESIIKQLPLPLFVHVLRMIWRNLLIFLHNLVIVPLLFLVLGKGLGWEALLSILGLLLLVLNLAWIALVLGVLCTRYRDLAQIVGSILQVMFYLTPIMWMPGLLPERAGRYLLALNPLFHWFETVRSPMLGQLPSLHSWLVCGVMAVAGWAVALAFFGRHRARIAYWL